MIKALFFDIDGTLVSFQTHKVPESTIKALTSAKSKGIRIFISTGRPKVIINNLNELEERHLIDGYVSMNGAYCFVGDAVIDSHCIPHESVLTIAAYVEKLGVPCIFVAAHDIHVYHPDGLVKQIFYDFLHVDKIPETSIEEAVKEDIYQITPFITTEQESLMMKHIRGCSGDRWHPKFTDIITDHCDKGSGVELMAKHFGLTQSEVMCFGDGGNDISMLHYASIGVAMGNANDFVKAEADYVTTDVDEDGILNALRHFNLI